MEEINWNDFEKVEMRVGSITSVEDFPEARDPAYKLTIDFGEEIGEKRSSAQITRRYTKEELPGRQVIAVVNFPVKRIAGFKSECLVLGVLGDNKDVVLLSPDQKMPNGSKIA
ncbi:tRNA-binding protein [Christiangramia forsetii]|uniref:Secretion chaperone CsaA n=2 Tax=Christiangramia forsetii TaxID=411153 RepID=A0M4E5_CHRFK|nr:tRNA-binding protein [Christiangramia forsetii]GGG23602.1 tRNA-binding protein [Christiangramia forsetii]CAL67490.1 secretion chaperone CsaA [Christiangramia forsetii KT0803]